jgi:hypothetical protein
MSTENHTNEVIPAYRRKGRKLKDKDPLIGFNGGFVYIVYEFQDSLVEMSAINIMNSVEGYTCTTNKVGVNAISRALQDMKDEDLQLVQSSDGDGVYFVLFKDIKIEATCLCKIDAVAAYTEFCFGIAFKAYKSGVRGSAASTTATVASLLALLQSTRD